MPFTTDCSENGLSSFHLSVCLLQATSIYASSQVRLMCGLCVDGFLLYAIVDLEATACEVSAGDGDCDLTVYLEVDRPGEVIFTLAL